MAINACGQESSRGTTLLWSKSPTGPFTEIGAVDTMPELSPTAELDECSDPYGSGEAAWAKYYKTGKIEGGDVTFNVNWISGDAEHDALEADLEDETESYFRIALSDLNATTRTFPALTTGVSHPVPQNGGKLQLGVTVRVNGQIVKAP
jgi:hypothetical protein